MSEIKITITGGDRRVACMVPLLRESGFRVLNPDGPPQNQPAAALIGEADVILGGIPMFGESGTDPEALLDALRKNAGAAASGIPSKMLFGGVIDRAFREEAQKLGVSCYDFMKVETIALFNTIATAEGAIAEAIRGKETNLHGSRCLVLGYGRCGRVLAQKLKGMDALVTVCCRKDTELAQAEAFGCAILPLMELDDHIGAFEYLFNTIPRAILQERQLQRALPGALIVDIASGRGGADYEAAKRLGINALKCPGLPGRYAPASSARVLADYVRKVCAAFSIGNQNSGN